MDLDNPADLVTTISYLPAEKGGLKVPIPSGFRSAIKFEFIEKQSFAEQVFEGEEMVFPGDAIEAHIKLTSPEFYTQKLTTGTAFHLTTTDKTIGTGIITQILNTELKKG